MNLLVIVITCMIYETLPVCLTRCSAIAKKTTLHGPL